MVFLLLEKPMRISLWKVVRFWIWAGIALGVILTTLESTWGTGSKYSLDTSITTSISKLSCILRLSAP